MKYFKVILFSLALLFGATLVSSQDLTTQLSLFLNDLYAGTIGLTTSFSAMRINEATPAVPTKGMYSGGTNDLRFAINSAEAFRVNATNLQINSRSLIWAVDNGSDIGAAGANRPRDVYSGRSFVSGGTGLVVANVAANSCGTTAATVAGGNNAFVITVGATSGSQCRITFSVAATTEWDCTVTDSTTTIATRATTVDTTHTDFLGAFVAADKVTGICFPR